MANTLQAVSWALERKCPFRSGETWFLPDESAAQLNDLRLVSEAEREDRLVDGICLTALTSVEDDTGENAFHSKFWVSHRRAVPGLRGHGCNYQDLRHLRGQLRTPPDDATGGMPRLLERLPRFREAG